MGEGSPAVGHDGRPPHGAERRTLRRSVHAPSLGVTGIPLSAPALPRRFASGPGATPGLMRPTPNEAGEDVQTLDGAKTDGAPLRAGLPPGALPTREPLAPRAARTMATAMGAGSMCTRWRRPTLPRRSRVAPRVRHALKRSGGLRSGFRRAPPDVEGPGRSERSASDRSAGATESAPSAVLPRSRFSLSLPQVPSRPRPLGTGAPARPAGQRLATPRTRTRARPFDRAGGASSDSAAGSSRRTGC